MHVVESAEWVSKCAGFNVHSTHNRSFRTGRIESVKTDNE